MSIWIVFAIYTLVSASGLLLIKIGAENTSLAVQEGLFNIQVSLRLFIGFLLYITSFAMSIYIMSKMKLSLFYPMGTGVILILTCLFGCFLLKENIGVWQLVGMILILVGVVAMNINTAQ